MRVPVLQEGGAPWRGDRGKLAEKKHLLWLKPPVLSATLLLVFPFRWGQRQGLVCSKELQGLGWARRAKSDASPRVLSLMYKYYA